MAVLSPPFALGATGQALSGRLLRLSLGATFRPAAAALAVSGGALYGPPGAMGEATLVNPTTLRIAPAVWVVQGSRTADQGQYTVPNDGNVDLTITAQHASQFRRSLWMVTAADSQAAGVASTATTDRAFLQLVDGPLSATSPAPLPTIPADSLTLGEVAIPPVGQTVTITPYNPRTVTRGGILPVANDTSAVPGHGGAAGMYVGDYRDHPTRGLERWNGTTWRFVGGGAPTVTPLTPGGGWAALNGLGIFIDGAGMRRLTGWASNTGAFTPAGGEVIATIPATPTGLRPASNRLHIAPVSIGHLTLQVEIFASDGTIRVARPYGSSIGINAVWSFDEIAYL